MELVVLHPDDCAGTGDLGGLVGEPLVDRHVRVPPLAMELRGGDHVVIQRPEGAVGEPLVVIRHLPGREGDRHQLDPVVGERGEIFVGCPVPADPGAVPGAHHRLERGDQAPGDGRQSAVPSGFSTRSTGSRLATTTNVADADVDCAGLALMNVQAFHRRGHDPSVVSTLAGPGRSSAREV